MTFLVLCFQHRLSFLELLCVYGYSLTIYIPVSIFWVIQLSWLQWMLVLVGASFSAAVLVGSIWPAISQIQARRYLVLGVVVALHVLLAAGFMLAFFHASPTTVKKETALHNVVPLAPVSETLNSSAHS